MNERRTDEQPAAATSPAALAEELARLTESVRLLTDRLDAFEAALRARIETRRVEVTAGDDAPRVVISADGRRATVEVRTRAPTPHSTAIALFATDQEDDNPAQVGLEIADVGDVVASLAAFERTAPTLWLATDDDRPSNPATTSDSGPDVDTDRGPPR